jgi:hypothetical protein
MPSGGCFGPGGLKWLLETLRRPSGGRFGPGDLKLLLEALWEAFWRLFWARWPEMAPGDPQEAAGYRLEAVEPSVETPCPRDPHVEILC